MTDHAAWAFDPHDLGLVGVVRVRIDTLLVLALSLALGAFAGWAVVASRPLPAIPPPGCSVCGVPVPGVVCGGCAWVPPAPAGVAWGPPGPLFSEGEGVILAEPGPPAVAVIGSHGWTWLVDEVEYMRDGVVCTVGSRCEVHRGR